MNVIKIFCQMQLYIRTAGSRQTIRFYIFQVCCTDNPLMSWITPLNDDSLIFKVRQSDNLKSLATEFLTLKWEKFIYD